MYNYIWDEATRGYKLTTQTGRFIANELRPVFAKELILIGFDSCFKFDPKETQPLLWAKRNEYLLNGEKVAQLNNTQYGKPLSPEFFFEGIKILEPVDIKGMIRANANMMDIIIADTKRRIKELYDNDIKNRDIAYIAFSGGKDSVVLLDICHHVLPLSVPIVFSDTDMELPDTYKVWEEVKKRYPEREFIIAKSGSSALDNWRRFGPPSRTIKWCCSVHKSTPAVITLKEKLQKSAIKTMAFVGVRGEESHSRSFYEDSTDGAKNASQINCMPILDWGAHEVWLYIFANDLVINNAYLSGLSRVGCIMCPEASDKHICQINEIFPNSLNPYSEIIVKTSNKNFKTTSEKNKFIGSFCWQIRKNGLVLREALTLPIEENNNLTTIFQSNHFDKDLFFEWIKTIGTLVKDKDTNQLLIKFKNDLGDGIPFSYDTPHTESGTVTFEFKDEKQKLEKLPILKQLMKKISACILCRSCEAECSNGAMSIKNNKIIVDADKCTKCSKCYDIKDSCWRFKSMYKPETERNNLLRGIANYETFGLREKGQYLWVSALAELGNDFFPWHVNHPLGKNMCKAARIWFQQAGLVYQDKKITPLVELFRKHGGSSSLGWEFIWMEIANNAMLIKWFITSTEIEQTYSVVRLYEILEYNYQSLGKSTIDGGLAALKDMLTKSPLSGSNAVTTVEMKGRTVKSITRKSKPVHSLTILYGLYLIAAKADRSSFTVRELLVADAESVYISPIVAFGISPDSFKKQCEGLRSKYPDYIETTFTHGNDELTVFPKKFSTEDIVKLALEI